MTRDGKDGARPLAPSQHQLFPFMGGIGGLTGVVNLATVGWMAEALVHRGPDDKGFFNAETVTLGVRRLSIIDVPGGHQPIANEDATVLVAFNGEIYNHQELRARLEGQGHASAPGAIPRSWFTSTRNMATPWFHLLQRMFAFAIWDAKRRRLLLARDRLGIKPLYYTFAYDHTLVFASEAKALFQHPYVLPEINPCALDADLSLRYVPWPKTMIRNVWKLPPGHLLTHDVLHKMDRVSVATSQLRDHHYRMVWTPACPLPICPSMN